MLVVTLDGEMSYTARGKPPLSPDPFRFCESNIEET
jgi:hypothetical protein